MNLLDFTIEPGFPFTESTVKFMQNQMLQLQYGSLLGGNNYILQGCAISGGNVANGWVVVNGEVLPFQGGPVQANVIVADIPTQREFFGGAQNNYYHDRTATFGTGDVQYAWSSFTRNDPANGVLARLDKVEKMLKPLIGYTATVSGVPTTVYGSWLFWGRPASEIPAGWEAVPDADWKGRFPVVASDTDTDFAMLATGGSIGGSKVSTLLKDNLPHTKLGIDVPAGSVATDDTGDGKFVGGANTGSGTTPISGGETEYLGNDTSFTNLPPYKVVMFIRFIG